MFKSLNTTVEYTQKNAYNGPCPWDYCSESKDYDNCTDSKCTFCDGGFGDFIRP